MGLFPLFYKVLTAVRALRNKNRMVNGYSFRPSPDYNPVCE